MDRNPFPLLSRHFLIFFFLSFFKRMQTWRKTKFSLLSFRSSDICICTISISYDFPMNSMCIDWYTRLLYIMSLLTDSLIVTILQVCTMDFLFYLRLIMRRTLDHLFYWWLEIFRSSIEWKLWRTKSNGHSFLCINIRLELYVIWIDYFWNSCLLTTCVCSSFIYSRERQFVCLFIHLDHGICIGVLLSTVCCFC